MTLGELLSVTELSCAELRDAKTGNCIKLYTKTEDDEYRDVRVIRIMVKMDTHERILNVTVSPFLHITGDSEDIEKARRKL